jgi:hypothetical protein
MLVAVWRWSGGGYGVVSSGLVENVVRLIMVMGCPIYGDTKDH